MDSSTIIKWGNSTIEEVCTSNGIIRGPFGGALKKENFVKKGIKVYEQKNAIKKDLSLGSYYISSAKFEELKRFEIREGDFIVSCSGTIGQILQIPPKFEKGIINQALLKLTVNNSICDTEYFLHLFRSESFQKSIIDNTQGGAMKNLVGMPVFKSTLIPLPPISEQRRIAEVLSDMDGLIGSMEKLLAKKRMIRQGMMQRLLTPQPDWEVKRLGEIGHTFGGLSGKSKKDFGNGNAKYIPFLNVINNPILNPEQLESVCIEPNEIQNKALLGDIFFNGSSETPDEVGLCSVLENEIHNLYLNSFCFGFRILNQEENTPLFLVYLFRSHTGRSYLYSLAQGATRYNLSKTNFMDLEIQIPGTIKQKEISDILQSADSEIATIQQKIRKYQNIKQGMMQNLLTGEVRLKG